MYFPYVTKTVKYGGFHILIWGAIKGDGIRTLVRCLNLLNSAEYQNVLSNGLFKIYDACNTFMQDGALCHKSRFSIKFLEDMNVCLMDDWPPQSPGLNVIEIYWSILKSQVLKQQLKSAEELWSVAQEEWETISNDAITKLYESIPRQIKAVLKAKGLHTKY